MKEQEVRISWNDGDRAEQDGEIEKRGDFPIVVKIELIIKKTGT
jgi:hypothetical protein